VAGRYGISCDCCAIISLGWVVAGLTNDVVRALVPEARAPGIRPAGVQQGAVEARLSSLDEIERRAFEWLTSLQAYAEAERFDRNYPGFQYYTFGFIPLGVRTNRNGVADVGGYTFGIALELETSKDGPPQEVVPLAEWGLAFSLVINRRMAQLHIPNPTTPPGTGACWGRSRKSAITPAADGVLTAEHVVSGTGTRISYCDEYRRLMVSRRPRQL
jgi:hypothetical protein